MPYTETGKMDAHTEVRTDMQTALDLIARRTAEKPEEKFTSLIHHLNEQNLKECYQMLQIGRAHV